MGFGNHFKTIKGNEFFCEIDYSYLEKNLDDEVLHKCTYLNHIDGTYDASMNILEFECNCEALCNGRCYHRHRKSDPENHICDEEGGIDQFTCTKSDAKLYGLLHARYIMTNEGMAKMKAKYEKGEFGYCPRVYCENQPLLPVGLSDVPKKATVKMYCPKCQDLFHPRSTRFYEIDGAYFGTGFPHMFLMAYPQLRRKPSKLSYIPMLYGFRLHPEAVELQHEKAEVHDKAVQVEKEQKEAAKKKEKEERKAREKAEREQMEKERKERAEKAQKEKAEKEQKEKEDKERAEKEGAGKEKEGVEMEMAEKDEKEGAGKEKEGVEMEMAEKDEKEGAGKEKEGVEIEMAEKDEKEGAGKEKEGVEIEMAEKEGAEKDNHEKEKTTEKDAEDKGKNVENKDETVKAESNSEQPQLGGDKGNAENSVEKKDGVQQDSVQASNQEQAAENVGENAGNVLEQNDQKNQIEELEQKRADAPKDKNLNTDEQKETVEKEPDEAGTVKKEPVENSTVKKEPDESSSVKNIVGNVNEENKHACTKDAIPEPSQKDNKEGDSQIKSDSKQADNLVQEKEGSGGSGKLRRRSNEDELKAEEPPTKTQKS